MKNKRCYARISMSNLLHNASCIKELLPDGCGMISVIKANAYSHGAAEFAHALADSSKAFAVAEMKEALFLRENGIKNDILVLGFTDPSFASVLADNGITQTVMSLEYARDLSKRLGGLELQVHIKLDTGMHRLGFDATSSSVISEIEEVSHLDGINIKGIFSHFAESDSEYSDYTDLQLSRFENVTKKLEEKGIDVGMKHISNSAAILTREDTLFSAVRPGIILYGAYPSEWVKREYLSKHPDMPFRQVMTLCARVGQVMKIKKGETVGYCRTHTAKRDTVIATVTAGYADGIPRALSNKGRVKINGEIFNIVGNVCMDLLMVDITDAKNTISMGDEVIFWGEDGISIDEYAELSGEISYTLYTRVAPRVLRIYE